MDYSYRLSVISYQGSVVCDLERGCPQRPVCWYTGEAKGRGGEGELMDYSYRLSVIGDWLMENRGPWSEVRSPYTVFRSPSSVIRCPFLFSFSN
jgi:hypothetical protein